MPSSLNLRQLVERFSMVLKSHGPLPGSEAFAILGISQSSFSRLVRHMEAQLIITGKARSTRYALRRNISGLDLPIPLYRVTEEGRTILLAYLHPVEPRGFYLESKQKNSLQSRVFEGLPYFLEDMRPSGFLGRMIPALHPELKASRNILDWSTEDCLRYWVKFGWNLPGNLLVGEKAFQILSNRYVKMHENPDKNQLEKSMSALAQEVLLRGEAGSSAGGEQPKFLLDSYSNNRPGAIVKFSPPVVNLMDQRIADLLVCEHLALEVLKKFGFNAANSRITREGSQVFLSVERFDRIPPFGRKGIVSIKALSLEYVGELDSWSHISGQLLQQKIITEEMWFKIRILEKFGHLIKNSDMHAGNLSFLLDESLNLAEIAPVYDMLPMAYYPRQNQIFDLPYEPSLPLPEENQVWEKAAEMALSFWKNAANDIHLSKEFRKIALDCHAKLFRIASLFKNMI